MQYIGRLHNYEGSDTVWMLVNKHRLIQRERCHSRLTHHPQRRLLVNAVDRLRTVIGRAVQRKDETLACPREVAVTQGKAHLVEKDVTVAEGEVAASEGQTVLAQGEVAQTTEVASEAVEGQAVRNEKTAAFE
jgi:hypothetical protein